MGFGVIVFLLVTPILVLYARGFKVDWKNKTLVKTGALVVRSEPKEATIYLNDEIQDSTTPSNLRFLIPADVNVRVEKEGYQSWTKRLTVKSQLVTWANENRDFITLFLSEPKLEQNWQTTTASISGNRNEIAFVSENNLRLLNVQNGEAANLANLGNINLPFAINDSKFSWQNSGSAFNILANKDNLTLLANQAENIQQLQIDSGHIITLIDSNLYSIESGNLKLIDIRVQNFTLASDGIWYISANQIKHYGFSSSPEIITSSLPTSTTSKLLRTQNQIYAVVGSNLYLISDKLENINSNVSDAVWDEKTDTVVYSNNNEIYIYDPKTKNSELIVRSLTPIKNPMLNEETGYMFYQNEGKIKAIELDGRDHRNIFTLADLSDPTGIFTISDDGKKLFTVRPNQINYYTIR